MIAHDRLSPELVGALVRVDMYAEAPREGIVVGLTNAGGAAAGETTWLQVDIGKGRIVERASSQCTEVSRGPEGDSGPGTPTPSGAWQTTF